eukprot:641818-Pyramimonas_sp.AAC.1
MPVISMDYCFVNTELETEMINILVMVQSPEDAVASFMVIHKGPSEYVNSALELYLGVCGAAGIILNGDQGPSLQAVITAIQNWGKHSTQVEKAPKGSHQSSGAIENAVEIDGELEAKLEVKIGPKSLIMPWLVRHVGHLLT